MKKIVFLFVLLLGMGYVCAHAYNTPHLNFRKEPGKFIYCNNPENIKRSDLADYSNRDAKFLMNNDAMTEDKYAIFLSHYNHTGVMSADGSTMLDPGFDIEVDVLFRAVEDTEITITSLGYNVPQKQSYWLDGKKYTEDTPIGCIEAWATYLGKDIKQLDSGEIYTPVDFEPVVFSLRAGEEKWLSEYIPNYCAVEMYRAMHLIADFEILKGTCDINVAALKSNGILRDRSHFNKNAAFAPHFNERQYKGIADSLNRVTASMYYLVDYYVYHGMRLPVTVYNSKFPFGNITNVWHTHLNPSSDWLDASGADESNMLGFTYKDPSKLKYYGRNVKDSEKEDVWYFDTKHNDLVDYVDGYGNKAYYKPNTNERTPMGYSHCNLGNYGVVERYNISMTNTTASMRYVNYKLKTGSNNIVILYDKDGNVMPGYPICKGYTEGVEEDTMACIALPPQQQVDFSIEVILTTNYYGDMAHSLVVTTEPETVQTYETKKQYIRHEYKHTGKEFYKWENGELYFSDDLKLWEAIELSKDIRDIVHGHWKEFSLTYTGDGYALRADNLGGIYFYFPQKHFRDIYFLDKNMNLVSSYQFIEYPSAFTAAGETLYADASLVYCSDDKQNWTVSGSGMTMPIYNYGRYAASCKNKSISLSVNGRDFYPVRYSGFMPEYIDVYAGIYFYIDGKILYTSYDGLYWQKNFLEDKINSLYILGNSVIINNEHILSLQPDDNIPAVLFDGVFIGYDNKPYIADGILMVPYKETLAALHGSSGNYSDGEVFVSLRQLAEISGYSVGWDEKTSTAVVTKIK